MLALLATSAAPPSLAQSAVFSALDSRLDKPVTSWQEMRETGIVRQQWDLSCGSAALSMVFTHFLEDPVPETAVIVWLLGRTDPVRVQSRGGFSLLDLKRFANARGYEAEGYADMTLNDLVDFQSPVIVPVSVKGYDHFVVFMGAQGDRVLLADPGFGRVTSSAARFEAIWQGGIGFVVFPASPLTGGPEWMPSADEFLAPDLNAVYRTVTFPPFPPAGASPVPR
jgi:predicted double-glycine peptidase